MPHMETLEELIARRAKLVAELDRAGYRTGAARDQEGIDAMREELLKLEREHPEVLRHVQDNLWKSLTKNKKVKKVGV